MQFLARIGLADGRVLEEIHHANDERSLRTELERRGVHIFEIKARGLTLNSATGGRLRGQKVKPTEFLVFNQEMAALLKAGLPLLQALDLMLRRMPEGGFRRVLEDIRDKVRTGRDLSDAFAEHADIFPRLYPSILKAGERSGELEQVIRRFIRYQQLVMEARKKVVSAMVYPAVLIVTSLLMIAVMVIYVIPKFQVIFENSDVPLPWITQALISTGSFFQNYWLPVIVSIAAASFLFVRWKRSLAGQRMLDLQRVKMPIIGPVLHRFALSEFSRSLATLLSGGMPLVPALEIAVAAVGNLHIREKLQPTIQSVREGASFHGALEHTGIVTDMVIDMVQVGEATGALDEMLGSVSDFLDEQVEVRMQRMLSLIEPVMLIFMGVVIAAILIALYLPLFSALSNTRG
jgi:type IV pilus assembly protein PilC